jgi:hypothetical protein
LGELPPNLQGSDERRLTSEVAVDKKVAGSAIVALISNVAKEQASS